MRARPLRLMFALLVALAACGNPPDAAAPTTPAPATAAPAAAGETATPMPDISAKLSPAAKQLLGEPEGEGAGQVDLLLRVDGALGPERRRLIEQAGATVRTVAGDVVSVSAPLDALAPLAALDFVLYIDASRPLAPEGRTTPDLDE